MLTSSWSRALVAVIVAVGFASPAWAEATKAERTPAPFERRIVREGIAVDISLEALNPGRPPGAFMEGDDVRVRLAVSDTHTGAPITTLYPAAWMDLLPAVPEAEPPACKTKVEAFVGGSILAVPELDLNVFYVLAMNDDPSISVVDPLFGFGGSQLLDMVILESPAEDWVTSIDQKRLFVSMPESDRVAVVETAGWSVEFAIDVGPTPTDMALQPDGTYLWVAFEGRSARESSGVSVIETRTLREVGRIETGRGRHRLALGADNRYAFVTNEASGTVSAIDIRKLEKVKDIATGRQPVSLAYSKTGAALFVSDQLDGTITVVDGESLEVVGRLETEPGLGQIRFSPDGRWGFAVNPQKDVVHILDSAARRIVQTGDTESGPDQVTFSDELVYLRHRGSETVLMIPFAGIGREGAAIPMVDFPGGEKPSGLSEMPSSADSIVQAPGAPAVLVANPLDRAIYYYKEGMAAPMGHFKNYGRQPRAAMVVDRSLRELEAGVYETTVKMRRPGRYDLALFLDSPRVIQCLELAVEENPVLAMKRQRFSISVELLTDTQEVEVGQPVSVKIKVLDSKSKEPRSELSDIEVMTFLAPGLRQQRRPAKALGEGIYELVFTPEQEGVYYVFVQIPSQRLRYRESPSLIVMAEKGGAA